MSKHTLQQVQDLLDSGLSPREIAIILEKPYSQIRRKCIILRKEQERLNKVRRQGNES